jgi:hypothetical protein
MSSLLRVERKERKARAGWLGPECGCKRHVKLVFLKFCISGDTHERGASGRSRSTTSSRKSVPNYRNPCLSLGVQSKDWSEVDP